MTLTAMSVGKEWVVKIESIEPLRRDRRDRPRSGKSGDGDNRPSRKQRILPRSIVPSLAGSEAIREYKGIQPDVIAGGFPCQDISTAGKGEGIRGKRSSLWWEMLQTICLVRPRYVIVENVANLTYNGLGEVLGSLAFNGYDAEWFTIQASDVGAPHRRKRLFILAYPSGVRCDMRGLVGKGIQREDKACDEAHTGGEKIPDPVFLGLEAALKQFKCKNMGKGGPWENDPGEDATVESKLGRVAYGVPDRVDRIKGLGNAVVPQVAEFIGRRIMEYEKMRDLRNNTTIQGVPYGHNECKEDENLS